MYRVFRVEDNRQYLAVATINPGERVNIPLAGIHAMAGNLRVVLIPEERAVEIHLTRDPRIHQCGKDVAGIDIGVTEVFTDERGKKYRPEYGDALQEMSGRVVEKGRARGKLWALRREFLKTDPAKAARILKHNLGFVKQDKRNGRYRARCENEINRAFNEFYRDREPASLAYEDLSHLRGKARSKGLSRKVSNWHRGAVKKRLEYKNHVHSVADPGPQNAAYSSQECPDCGWVDAGNRHGDVFKCRKCGFTADADQVAAINLKKRMKDKEITRHTPYKRVKQLLLQRYRDKREAS
jgi:transposase